MATSLSSRTASSDTAAVAREAPPQTVAGAVRLLDAQTVAEVTATWRQYLACISAGDQARMFALLSDAMVRRQFVVDVAFGVSEDALFAYLAATPVPLPPDQSVPFDALRRCAGAQ